MHILILSAAALALTASPVAVPVPAPAPGWRLDASALGELGTHPGAALGIHWTPSGAGSTGFVLGALASGYRHAGNNTGLRLELRGGFRLQLPWNLALEAAAGAGYLHTFLDAPLYDAVTGEPIADLGRPSFSPGLTLAACWRQVFLRGGVFGQYPFNGRLLLHPAVELGMSFDLGGAR